MISKSKGGYCASSLKGTPQRALITFLYEMARMNPTHSPFPGRTFRQILPQPERREPGDTPVWHAVAERVATARTIDVEDALRRHGRHVSFGPIPHENQETISAQAIVGDRPLRRSAVLVCLSERDGATHVVLTRRAQHLRSHKGEVAFPGGRCEPGESAEATALREAHEEIGLPATRVQVVGWLSPIVTLASHSAIVPVVAICSELDTFVVDPNEVDAAFTLPLAHLVDRENFAEERWWRTTIRETDEEGAIRLQFFQFGDDLIWGATARILTELLSLLAT